MADESKEPLTGKGEVSRRGVLAAASAVATTAIIGGTAGAAEVKFDPNKLTFAQGIERIKKAIQGVPAFGMGKIVTSRTEGADKIMDALKTHNVPAGFTKYQLPVYFEGGPGTQFFISIGAPNTEVPRHSHNEGDGIRFIISGSIIYDGKELTGGDWMFIPKGQAYSFKVGRNGAWMVSGYCCCC